MVRVKNDERVKVIDEYFNDAISIHGYENRYLKYKNRKDMAFYDAIPIDADNGEKYLLTLVSPRVDVDINETRESFADTSNENYYKTDIVKSGLLNNPLTFALNDTVRMEDPSLKDEQVMQLIKGRNSNPFSNANVFNNNKDIVYRQREDEYTLFNNDDLGEVAIKTRSYDPEKQITMPMIIDRRGNYFMLQNNFMDRDLTLLNISKLMSVGLEQYVDEADLPILENYLYDLGTHLFNFNRMDDVEDIKNVKNFYKEFGDIFHELRAQTRYKTSKDKQRVESMSLRRRMEGGITRFNIDGETYFILPKKEDFNDNKRTINIINGQPINKVTVENMYSFINETNKIYKTHSPVNEEELGYRAGELQIPMLFELIEKDALTPVIKLYLYHRYAKEHNVKFYNRFEIRNEKGKVRVIHEPNEELKEISREINEILSKSVDKTAKKRELDDTIIGYRLEKNIQDNALQHAENEYIIKADFKDYFNSIKPHHVSNTLTFLGKPSKFYHKDDEGHTTLSDRRYNEGIMELFTDTIFNPETGGLYMGNPVSGALSNLAVMKIVKYIDNICKNKGITFTIYADDLTFSVPKADKEGKRLLNKEYIEYIVDHVLSFYSMGHTLKLNEKKTMSMSKQKRRITGIRLNDSNELTWDRNKYRELRVVLHKLSQGEDFSNLSMNRNELKGNLNFFHYTESRNKELETPTDKFKIVRLMKKYEETILDRKVMNKEEFAKLTARSSDVQ